MTTDPRALVLEVPDRFNFARDTFDAHARATPDRTAMVWLDDAGTERRLSFGELSARSRALARGLRAAGLERGDVVLVVLPRLVAWWELHLAGLRAGLVLSPGTMQLTPKDLAYRLGAAGAKAVVTDPEGAARFDRALALRRDGGGDAGSGGAPPDGAPLRILVTEDAPGATRDGWTDLEALRAPAPGDGDPAARADTGTDAHADEHAAAYADADHAAGADVDVDTAPDDPAFLFFTSGTTGPPKMTVHTQASYGIGHTITGRAWLGLSPDDLHWNLSDTGWAKAAWSSLLGPWIVGAAVFVHHASRFDPARTLELLAAHPITSLCGAPTNYRLLVQQDLSTFRPAALRSCVAAGEPLNPEVMDVWRQATGVTIRDGFGQTETVLLVGNLPGDEIRPGSMGRPAPGFDVAVLGADGEPLPPGEEGEIAVRVEPQRPVGLFGGYLGDPERTASVFVGDWYLTGDRATLDEDGYLWFVGRADDVINASGYRIGPFEVESALLEHPAVAESAAVGAPDPTRGTIVCAFVVLAAGHAPGDALVAELQDFVKAHTAPYKYPRRIEFVDELPKTVSGKIRRVELRERAARGSA